jgi:hypothetical protein
MKKVGFLRNLFTFAIVFNCGICFEYGLKNRPPAQKGGNLVGYWFFLIFISPYLMAAQEQYIPFFPKFKLLFYKFKPIDHTFKLLPHKFKPMDHTFKLLFHKFKPICHKFKLLSHKFKPMDRKFKLLSHKFKPIDHTFNRMAHNFNPARISPNYKF